MSTSQNKKVQVLPDRKPFQFSEFQEEIPTQENIVVVLPEKVKSTGPWSDDLVEDRDDPSWTTVSRKKRKTK